jgi:hypothetical protein
LWCHITWEKYMTHGSYDAVSLERSLIMNAAQDHLWEVTT